ncbi:hypothetical protein ACIHEI_35695 [Kitasatospora sp. NPDC051984]|uniref:hypothetical protein n=1 Tax=Kitasatospora sp. NPDC051984 TaxID=3364059 RepID=UPI0037CA5C2E
MRALKRVLAVSALAAPLVLGCAGLASAHGHEGHEGAEFNQGQFIANEEGAGEAKVHSEVDPCGVEHSKGWVFAGDEGVEGSHTESGAHF